MDQNSEQYIRRADVAQHFPFLSQQLLNHLAYRNRGPLFIKAGKEALYKMSDLIDYIKNLEEQARLDRERKLNQPARNRGEGPRRPGRPRKQPPTLSIGG
jgi:hypothetical protein